MDKITARPIRPRVLQFVLRGGGKKDTRWGLNSAIEALDSFDILQEDMYVAVALLREWKARGDEGDYELLGATERLIAKYENEDDDERG